MKNNMYALLNVNHNAWVHGYLDGAYYGPDIKLFNKNPQELCDFAQNIANNTGDEIKVYKLMQTGVSYNPTLISQMSEYTKVFNSKVAEFVHNTAIRFGNTKEDKLNIAKDLTESLEKALCS